MTDTLNTPDETLIEYLDDNKVSNIAITEKSPAIPRGARRCLEEKLAERQLASEIREYDFDF
jgi:hypothetical protein